MFDSAPSPAAASEGAPASLPADATPPNDPLVEYVDEADYYRLPEDYDPKNYRWVPVRRIPRSDGWTEEKQRRFIEALADTGQVSLAAKEVGLSREAAYRLKRSPHGAAFARAWDAARQHAGSFLEDVAFERAIEGAQHPVFNEHGEVVCTKRVTSDRLLMFLLRNLKPERYAQDRAAPRTIDNRAAKAEDRPSELESSLAEMEPRLPAPPEALMDEVNLGMAVSIAEMMDGELPDFYTEQRPAKSEERLKQEALAARIERGRLADEKLARKEKLSKEEWRDLCIYYEPAQADEQPKRLYR